MKDHYFLFVGVVFYSALLFGLPLSLNAGSLSLTGDKLVYFTQSSSLAHLLESAKEFEVRCEGGGSICATPSTDSRLRPGVPIPFEPCFFRDMKTTNLCLEPKLLLRVSTREWLLNSLGGK